MITSTVSQFFVILLFLMLGVLLYTFAGSRGIEGASGDRAVPPGGYGRLPAPGGGRAVHHRADIGGPTRRQGRR